MRATSLQLQPVSALLLSEDPLVRAGLASLLGGEPERLTVHPVEGDLSRALEDLQPDVIVLDFGIAAEEGLERLRELEAGTVPVLALVPGPGDVVPALDAGASGVLSRDAGVEALSAAIIAQAHGLAVFDRAFLSMLLLIPARTGPELSPDALTAREREVMSLLAEGLSNKLIARRLQISEHTAKFHVNAILQKLGVQRRVEAVVRAARLGLIDL